jgi:AraC-like DNA-binding protein
MNNFKYYKADNQLNITGFYTAFALKHPEKYVFEGEAHNFWEVMYVKKGSVSVSADERIYELGEGEMIFHKPMEFHKFINTGESKLSIFVISFSATGSLMKKFENGVFILSREQQYEFCSLMDYLRDCCTKNFADKGFSFFEDCDVTQWHINILKNAFELFLLRDLMGNRVIKPALSTAEAIVFKEAVKYMHNNIHLPLNVNDISGSCNVSLSYLKKIFSKYAGIGVHEYFLNLKITEATKLLKEGISVTETAERLSFSSQNYFSTVYKRVTGSTPNKIKGQIS